MRLNEKEIENIICNSVTENLICRALELRPGELAKFICGLANVNGGYILVGVEKDNGLLKPKGLQLAFDMKSIMNSVDKNLDGTCQFGYGYVNVSGKNIFVIKVERAKQKILVDNEKAISLGIRKVNIATASFNSFNKESRRIYYFK